MSPAKMSLPSYEDAIRHCDPAPSAEKHVSLEVPSSFMSNPNSVENSTSGMRCATCSGPLEITVKYHITCDTHITFLAIFIPILIGVLILIHFDIFPLKYILLSFLPITLICYYLKGCRQPRNYCSFCDNRV
ncbi:uncharacterized protein LOC129577439 isoform X2 [Sitodiplosis mosellana]|uniref:uncharacterized protein LOC129577439 isoform X2 n=1 Tax=Sitodiplosis mosellana TaxID=263140 RepID=UPI002443A935|nr:uncharacterized protein LOC129577439 isoform X2 [Sitodiplosis mosellana]